ncbi:hypothetical protein NRK68_31370 [Streptomyces yangpuensis]|uniref:Uncharacterized protein n=1 Tax=Streptomyces yangpuensis TaxID=1648182 RepID=A0ABY5Q4H6_9ACTN|nr:hypothetical protein [Streptomyces yangpuensis]UUY51336.1 hypothetical protein NRK68_31370 [Streptomyces yangpuensis]
MVAAEVEALLTDRGQLGDHVTPEEVAAGRTHARTGALPRPAAGRYPLIVLSRASRCRAPR